MPLHSYSHMNTLYDLSRGQRHGTARLGNAWGRHEGMGEAGQGKVGQKGSGKLKATSIVLQSVGSIFRDTPGKTQQSG